MGQSSVAIFVVVFAKDSIVAEVEAIAYAKPLVALLTGEAFQVVNVCFSPHHHLKGRDDFGTGGATARGAKQSEVIAFAKDFIGFRVQGGSHFTETTPAASAFEAILVPVPIQGLET